MFPGLLSVGSSQTKLYWLFNCDNSVCNCNMKASYAGHCVSNKGVITPANMHLAPIAVAEMN